MSAGTTAITPHERPNTNTGVSNGVLGIMCFLTSEMALFGSLIFMYLYTRRAAPVWPPLIPGTHTFFERFDWRLPTVNTIVLLSSGVTMHFAYQALRRGDTRRMLFLLIVTIVLGVGFLSGQAYEYLHVVDVRFSSDTYGSTFFLLTGLHGIHVTGGVIFLLVVLIGTLRGKYTQQNDMVVHASTLYWHFVDAVWVVLFALFYLTVPIS
ncbi:MAG: cytochrome c oxidase subunit 3 [Chloroflexota bacterium]